MQMNLKQQVEAVPMKAILKKQVMDAIEVLINHEGIGTLADLRERFGDDATICSKGAVLAHIKHALIEAGLTDN